VSAISEELEFSELHQDSRMLVAAFRKINELMAICGVEDFGFQDLFKPDPNRLVRILSHVINFFRFVQQNCLEPFQNVANQAQERKGRVNELLNENEMIQDQIKQLKQRQKQEEPLIAKAEQFTEKLMEDLRSLKGEQTTLQDNMQATKDDKKAMINQLVGTPDASYRE
jgi:kinetochore protein Nuf2